MNGNTHHNSAQKFNPVKKGTWKVGNIINIVHRVAALLEYNTITLGLPCTTNTLTRLSLLLRLLLLILLYLQTYIHFNTLTYLYYIMSSLDITSCTHS